MTKSKHASHSCQAIVVSCMDFRLGGFIHDFGKKIKGGYNRLSIAGSVKNLDFVLEQIGTSYKLHNIKEVYLINHQDCGAYGSEGTFERHKKDLIFAKKKIQKIYPKLKVVLLYLKLDGEFMSV